MGSFIVVSCLDDPQAYLAGRSAVMLREECLRSPILSSRTTLCILPRKLSRSKLALLRTMFLRFCTRASAVMGRSCEAASKRRFCPDRALQDSVLHRSYSAHRHLSSPLNLASPANDLIRMNGSPDMLSGIDADSLRIWPSFLDKQEQETLLLASLKKLDDATGSREERKRRRQWLKSLDSQAAQLGTHFYQ